MVCLTALFNVNVRPFIYLVLTVFSDHKTAMLEQLKRSKKEQDATKLYSCEGCQKKVITLHS